MPNRCVVTGQIVQDANGLSSDGFKKIQFITHPYCNKCGAPLRYSKAVCKMCINDVFVFQDALSIFIYDEHSKKLILKYKHGDRLNLTSVFAQWIVRYGAAMLEASDILIPVPLHSKRIRQRMYNQAAELVKGIHQLTQKPYVLDGLIRVRPTKSQGQEDRNTRIRNMQEAFQVNPSLESRLQGKSITIVDDVMTTGATLNACAQALLPLSPKKISVLTLGKVLLL